MKLRLILPLLAATIILSLFPQSLGWRGIIPLHSTRVDVERLLGAQDLKCQCYETESEVVHISFATGPCKGDLLGWNVPEGTVLKLRISPKLEMRFSDLNLQKEDFVKTSDDTFSTYYANASKGIRYAVSYSGILQTISYVPSLNDNNLRCEGFPLADGGVTSYQPYTAFPYADLDDITTRLGEFGVRLRKSPESKGYVVVYAGRDKKIEGVAMFSNKAKLYLVKELQIDSNSIEAINGGYRDEPVVELFLIHRDWPPPIPTPTFPGVIR